MTAFHFLMGFWTEGVISFTVLYIRLQIRKLRLKPATKPRLPSKIVIDPGLGLKVSSRVYSTSEKPPVWCGT